MQFWVARQGARVPARACPLAEELLTEGRDVDGGLRGRPRVDRACCSCVGWGCVDTAGAVHYFSHVNVLRWF